MYPGVSWDILGCPGVIRLTLSKVHITLDWHAVIFCSEFDY